MKNLAVLALAASAASALAQSPFQDARGDSTLLLEKGGYFQIAFDKSSARLGYLFDTSGSRFYGFDLYGKLQGDSAGLFGDGKLLNNARLVGTVGWRLGPTIKRLSAPFEDRKYEILRSKTPANNYLEVVKGELVLIGSVPGGLKGEVDKIRLKYDLAEVHDITEPLRKIDCDLTLSPEQRETKKRKLREAHEDEEGVKNALKAQLDYGNLLLAKVAEHPKQDDLDKYVYEQKLYLNRELIKAQTSLEDIDKCLAELEKAEIALGVRPYQTFAIQASGRAASYKLFDPDQPFDSQFSTKRFEGWGVNAVLNGLAPSMRWGISIGAKRDNNEDDLKLTDLTERQTFTEDGVTRVYDKKVTAYVGDYEVKTRIPFNTDFAWWPKELGQKVGLNFYTRMDLSESDSFRPGVGLFLSKPGAPAKVLGGVTVSFFHGKPQAAIIAGYSF